MSCIETCRIVFPAVCHIDTLCCHSPETGINFAKNSQKCCKIYRELCLLLACQTSIQILAIRSAIRERYLLGIVWWTDEYNEQSLFTFNNQREEKSLIFQFLKNKSLLSCKMFYFADHPDCMSRSSDMFAKVNSLYRTRLSSQLLPRL